MKFIAAHADQDVGGLRWGVEPICRVLSEHGCPIAPSTYYDTIARARNPPAQDPRDEALKVENTRVYADNYGVYGAPARSGSPSTVKVSQSHAALSNG